MNRSAFFTRALCPLAILATRDALGSENLNTPIRLGFTSGIFKNLNENDALAAMMAWAQAVSKNKKIQMHPQMTIYYSLKEAEEALRTNQIDGITLQLEEYADLPENLTTGPFYRHEKTGSSSINYVLVVAANSGIQTVDQLSQARLSIYSESETTLAEPWLRAQCQPEKFDAAFNEIDHHNKLSKTVLSVFFGKSDACLVTRSGFESMVELNPQVGKKLTVIMQSPPVIPSFLAFNSAFSGTQKKRFINEISNLHNSIPGEQVLNVFRSEKMVAISPAQMEHSIRNLTYWRNATKPHNKLKHHKSMT